MRIPLITALYPPEPVVSARTSADLATSLNERGCQVTVLAPYPSRPSGRRYPGYPRRLYHRETLDGIEVIRCLGVTSSESSLTSRLWENLTFGLTSAWRLLWLRPKPQVIYANTWPLIAQGLLALVARSRNIPFVLTIQDLYPESLFAQGRIRPESRLAWFLKKLDRWIAHRSTALVVITPSFASVYQQERGLPAGKIHFISNWIEADDLLADFSSLEGEDNPIRMRYSLSVADFLLVYAGNISAASGVETLLAAMPLLRDIPTVHLLLAGEGAHLEACQNLTGDLKLERVHFLSPWPMADTAAVLSAADLLLLPTRGDQSLASLPSKLAYYLLAGRPVLTAAGENTDLAAAVIAARCGWLVHPDDPSALAESIRRAVQTPRTELLKFGLSARAYALAHFTRQANLPRLVALLESLASPASSQLPNP